MNAVIAAGGFGPDSIFELSGQILQSWTLWTIVIIVAEVCALISLVNVIMLARTAAGAWAWAMALIFCPFLAVPLYWVLGRNTFYGYRQTLRQAREKHQGLVDTITEAMAPHLAGLDTEQMYYGGVLEQLSERRFTRGNSIELLIDGPRTFDAIFEAIDAAEDYILVQFFIVRDDELGEELKRRLLEKRKTGIRVYLLYDEIGSHSLAKRYIRELEEAGVHVTDFQATRGKSNRFQVNFRNHRKIVVVDGKIGFVGGHNVGDEYLGKSKRFGHWRDTHVRFRGPAVLSAQLVFLGDWYWAVREVPELNWGPGFLHPDGGMTVLPVATGPIDSLDSGTLFFLNAINRAREYLWIASPYFVPDEPVRTALQLAALRGVDVRIMIPDKPDKRIPWLASFSYLKEMDSAGVRMFRYTAGFQHQKVILVDEGLASVGTANLDFRSLRLNFEVNTVVLDAGFCRQVREMLEQDFADCREVDYRDFSEKPVWFRVGVRLARLMAPVL